MPLKPTRALRQKKEKQIKRKEKKKKEQRTESFKGVGLPCGQLQPSAFVFTQLLPNRFQRRKRHWNLNELIKKKKKKEKEKKERTE